MSNLKALPPKKVEYTRAEPSTFRIVTKATKNENVADPITGEEIEQTLRNRPKDPKLMKLYRQLIGAGPLPPPGSDTPSTTR